MKKTKSTNHFISSVAVAGLFFITSCGESAKTNSENSTTTTEPIATETVKAPIITIDGTTWVATDLSSVSNMVPIIVNLPKDVKMEKNGNGGVDIHLNEAYGITVSTAMAVSNIKQALDSDKSLFVNNTTSYKNGKILIDEANGNVYSMQMKDEENGTKYEPENHFTYYLEKDGAVYSIMDVRPMDNFFLPGSTYTEANAKKLYDIVKSSAKIK